MGDSCPQSGRFTDHLWDRTKSLRAAIEDLEFLRRLGDGTLPLPAFRFYVEQDELYLTGFARALALTAAQAPDPQSAAFWAISSATATTVESTLHESLLAALPPADAEPEPSPTCLGYYSYLIATAATAPYPVAAAAVLPCFWIYAEVGRDLARSAQRVLDENPDHPYARWVSTYDAPEFQESAAKARALVDAAAEAATEADRLAMAEAFTVAMRYELMFWDTALHPLPWPSGDTE